MRRLHLAPLRDPLVASFLLALVLGAGLLPARSAAAQARDVESEARLHFELGRRAYEGQRFEDAAHEFEAALALVERPTVHFNLFRTYGELGDMRRAAEHLRAYIPHEPNAITRANLQARLERMEAQLGANAARDTAATTTATNGTQGGASTNAAGATTTHVTTTTQLTSTTRASAPVASDAGNGTTSTDASPAASATDGTAQTDTSEEPPPHRASLAPSIVTLAIGAVGLGTFAILGSLSKSRVSSLRDTCAPTCAQDDVDGAKRMAAIADVGLLVGIAGVAVGSILLATALASNEDEPHVDVAATPSSLYLGASGRF